MSQRGRPGAVPDEGRVQCPIKLFAALAGEIRNFRDEQEID
jgi:hypothetical protein